MMTDKDIPAILFRRRWRKYYDACEVDLYLEEVTRGYKAQCGKLESLQKEQREAQLGHKATEERLAELEHRALEAEKAAKSATKKLADIEQRMREAEEEARDAVERLESTTSQLTSQRADNARQAELLDQQAVELVRLQTRTDRLNELIVKIESQSPVDQLLDAEQQARKMLENAKERRDRIFKEATQRRTRMVAASRAAYFHAMQFKQDLTDHYQRLEKELNASLEVLRDTDSMHFFSIEEEENLGIDVHLDRQLE